MRTLGWLATAFGIIGLLAVPATLAWAQDYPLETGDLQLDGESGGTPVLATGESITIAGGGFVPGSLVVVTIESEPVKLGEVAADARGDFSITVTVPAGFPSGDHTIKATGQDPSGGVLVLGQAVTVAGDDVTDAGLPRTGSDAAVLLAVGGLLLLLGGGAVAVGRARHATSA